MLKLNLITIISQKNNILWFIFKKKSHHNILDSDFRGV